MSMFFNNYKVCQIPTAEVLANVATANAHIIHARLGPDEHERHEVSFVCPPKRIMIDGVERRMRYDTPVPCIEMHNGRLHAIRFDGPPRPIHIDDTAYEVAYDRPRRIKLGGRAHELAWGGPGFELIVDGKAHELQFNQPPREILIGTRTHMVHIEGGPPEVKILGRLPPELLNNPDGYHNHHQQHMQPSNNEHRHQLQQQQQQQQQVDLKPVLSQQPSTNVHELLKKLMEHKILPSAAQAAEDEAAKNAAALAKQQQEESLIKERERLRVPDLGSFESDLLKQKYDGAIKSLYSGVQCAQCGNRFNQNQDTASQNQQQQSQNRYSKHLDWHFRQNRREKEEVNKAHSRAWFYSVTEWIFYEEISEDFDLQQQQQQIDSQINNNLVSHFENGIDIDDLDLASGEPVMQQQQQQQQQQTDGDPKNSDAAQMCREYVYGGSAGRTCAATDDIGDSCCICNDPFEIFWFAEKEEWHFKDAVRVDNRIYHPICYEDASDVSF
jgi:hypothetical protein